MFITLDGPGGGDYTKMTLRFHLTTARMATMEKTSAGEKGPSYTVGRDVNGCNHNGNKPKLWPPVLRVYSKDCTVSIVRLQTLPHTHQQTCNRVFSAVKKNETGLGRWFRGKCICIVNMRT